MQLTYRDGYYYLTCSFTAREEARRAGLFWDGTERAWTTRDAGKAAKFRVYADDAALAQLNRTLIQKKEYAGKLLVPPGLKLLPHQEPGVRFILGRSRSYLAADPGLGKTPMAAVAAASLGAKVVYVCPPFLALNTLAEFERWAPSLKTATYLTRKPREECDVWILPDSRVSQARVHDDVGAFVKGDPKATLYIDEAHRFKNEDTHRTQGLFSGLLPYFERVTCLSGTPMPNRPMELFTVLSRVAPETIDYMGRFDFGRKYCGAKRGHWGWDFSGASNLPELKKRVQHPTGPFMLRLRKDVLNLPPRLEEVVLLEKDRSPKIIAMERKLLEHHSPEDLMHYVAARKVRAEEGKSEDEELHVATYRRVLGAEKIVPAASFLRNILDEYNEPVVAFTVHKEVNAGLALELQKYGVMQITGDTPTHKRQGLVNDFQKGKYRVALLNITAGGVGFTLTKARRVVMVEWSWVPGENDQAIDRTHRIGQTKTVLAQYLCYRNSIDKTILEINLAKRKTLAYI